MTWADVARAALRRVKAAVLRLGEGTKVAALRLGRWPAKPIPPAAAEDGQEPGVPGERSGGSILARWAWLAFLAWLAWASVQRSHPLAGLLALGWCCAAWRAGGAAPAASPQTEEYAEPQPQPAAPREEQLAYVLGVIRGLIGYRTGVHLTEVRDELVKRGSIPAGLRTATIRLSVERLGIPVRDQLHLGRANRPGVHRDDLAALGGGEAATTPPRLVLIQDRGSSAA